MTREKENKKQNKRELHIHTYMYTDTYVYTEISVCSNQATLEGTIVYLCNDFIYIFVTQGFSSLWDNL